MNMMKRFLSSITVEPVIFLYALAGELSGPTTSAFIRRQICVERFSNSTSICADIYNTVYHKEQELVQNDASYWIMYGKYCVNIPAMFFIMLYGTVHDAYNQKVAISAPIIMTGIQTLVFTLLALLHSFPLPLLVIGPVLEGLGGSLPTFVAMTMAYIACVTDKEKRTERMALAAGLRYLAALIAYSVGGALLLHTNFIVMFSFILVIYIFATIYVCIRIKPLDIQSLGQSHRSIFKNAFWEIPNSIMTLFRKRSKRCQLLLILCIAGLIFFGTRGT